MSQEATDTARAVLALREKHRRLITDKLGRAAANGHCVLEYLYEHPIARVSHVQNWIEASYPAANNLVARMANCGILEEFTGHSRNRAFRTETTSSYSTKAPNGKTANDRPIPRNQARCFSNWIFSQVLKTIWIHNLFTRRTHYATIENRQT